MAEDIKNLIEKIQQEGINAAEEKARDIEEKTKRQAEEILAKAKRDADEILASARLRANQTEEKTRSLLSQAARDLFLSIRRQIDAMLERLIISEAGAALGANELQRVISDLVKTRAQHIKDEVLISLRKEDLEILEKGFLKKLAEETKKKIVLRPLSDIRAGFTISFDSGRSCYDFTDKALAEYIGGYLKPGLNELFKGAAQVK